MPPPIGPQAGQVTQDAHLVAVEIDLSEIAGRMEREAMRLFTDLSQQGLSGEALARAVKDGLRQMSDAPIERAARGAVGEAFNLGRNLEAQRRGVVIDFVTRTEILDNATCPPCREQDGKRYRFNSPEYFENMPPNHCEGREQCRGFYVYEEAPPGTGLRQAA